MNYAKMSDFEINRKVLAITSGAKPLGYAHDADKRSAGIVKSNEYRWYDYCNSWADAGPIIQKESICLEKDTDRCCDDCMEVFERDTWQASHCTENIWYNDKNPLRAAMIVFLMMQENKDE